MKSNSPIKTFTLMLEGPAGVLEAEVGIFEINSRTYLKAIRSERSSGSPPLISRTLIHDAVKTQQWAEEHSQVFEECRVS